ncbi:MAG: outer membrane lipoprotein carrier protein LolA [Phycisphaerales bacterium]|nr:MAG: outer membrane lipoprotein carrier protein LolA [Phycisphaerales bacterium]
MGNLMPTMLTVVLLTHAAAFALTSEDPPKEPTISEQRERLNSQQTDDLLAQIGDTLSGLKSLKADFVQQRHMAAFEDALVAKGTMYFQTPGKIRWELREPYRSALIFDGDSVAKYLLDEPRPRRLKAGSSEVMKEVLRFIALWIQGDFERSRRVFDLHVERECLAPRRGEVDGQVEEVCVFFLVFTPRSSRMTERIRSIELALDEDSTHIDRVTIREKSGDHIVIRFANKQPNLKLADQLFALD